MLSAEFAQNWSRSTLVPERAPLHPPLHRTASSSCGGGAFSWRDIVEVLIRIRGFVRYFPRNAHKVPVVLWNQCYFDLRADTCSSAHQLPQPCRMMQSDGRTYVRIFFAMQVKSTSSQLQTERTAIRYDRFLLQVAAQGKHMCSPIWLTVDLLS
jgi:hypothetical protein